MLEKAGIFFYKDSPSGLFFYALKFYQPKGGVNDKQL